MTTGSIMLLGRRDVRVQGIFVSSNIRCSPRESESGPINITLLPHTGNKRSAFAVVRFQICGQTTRV